MQPRYSYNPCRPALQQAAEASRQAVVTVQKACEDGMRAQERVMRDKLGILAPAVMPATGSVPYAPKSPPRPRRQNRRPRISPKFRFRRRRSRRMPIFSRSWRRARLTG